MRLGEVTMRKPHLVSSARTHQRAHSRISVFRNCERGNITVEFIGVVVGLLLPILGLVFASVSVAKSYVVQENAVRLGARVMTVSATHSVVQAKSLIRETLSRQGIPLQNVAVNVTCSSRQCSNPSDVIRVSINRNYVVRILGFSVRRINISSNQLTERGVG